MTKIAGKDAALEDTLSRFKRIARELDLDLVEEQWYNPLPYVWSVHLAVASCPAIYSNGKGSSKEAALCSAYGEIYERLATHMSFSDYYLGETLSNDKFVHFPDEKWTPVDLDSEEPIEIPADILNAKLRKLYCGLKNNTANGIKIGSRDEHDEDEELKLYLDDLVDLQSGNIDRGICSLPFTNARNGEIVYFPVNLLDNLYMSNGMSAGNTEYEALVQGLSEILERYVRAKIITEGLSLPEVPEKILEKYPKSYQTFKMLQSDELKVICYDASLGGRFPVVCVVLFNQSNGTCVASFGSHPVFEAALDRTLTELLQGRTLSDLDDYREPSFDLVDTASNVVNLESHFVDATGLLPVQMFKKQPMFKFVAWDFDGNTHDQYKALRYIIDKLGFDIYVRTYQNLGVPVYRIIVPGMSEIYPFDDLVYNNNNKYTSYRDGLLSLPDSEEEPQAYSDYIDELESEKVPTEELVARSLGIMATPDSPWSTLSYGELLCLLALAAGDHMLAGHYAHDTLSFGQGTLGLSRRRFYQCLIKYIECTKEHRLNIADYRDALSNIYGQKTFEAVEAHMKNEQKFFGLEAIDGDLTSCEPHQAMLKIYQLIKNAALSTRS